MSNLQSIRNHKGLSQQNLADISNISVRNIQYYEQGVMNIDGAKLATLLALSTSLGCRVSDIIENPELRKNLSEKGY